MKKTTVAVVGLGLMGGSLGQALRRTSAYRVIGIGRKAATLREAKRLGAADIVSSNIEDVRAASIIVLAMPVAAIVPTFKHIIPYLKPGTLVTDVGSVKGPLLKKMAPLLQGSTIRYVGGHPLAGSHKTGVRAARHDLFKGATCVLVPLQGTNVHGLDLLWTRVGARPLIMTAQAHDKTVALTSHLPHMIAHALTLTARRRAGQNQVKALMAGSFRDVTRVASADPQQWDDIFTANAPALRHAIEEFKRELDTLSRSIAKPSLLKQLKKSQTYRRPLFHGV